MFERQTDVTVIAEFLRDARSRNRRVTLFLGARTGGLYSNENLYRVLKSHILKKGNSSILLKQALPPKINILSLLDQRNLSSIDYQTASDRFRECYSILENFSENGIHTIFVDALAPVRYREEDELLAGLMKAGFFDTVITTNIDTLLEDSCEALWDMKQPDDYEVVRCGINKGELTEYCEKRYGRVIKVFGDLSYLNYKSMGDKFDLNNDERLKKFLHLKLSEEVLVVGYDPIWDQTVEQAFQMSKKAIWYINEELPPPDTHLARILKRRETKSLIGSQGSYSNFVKTLYKCVGEGIDYRVLPYSKNQKNQNVFICYNSQDKLYVERLKKYFETSVIVYDDKKVMERFRDSKLKGSIDWKKEIKSILENTRIVILLVSVDFLASDFIREYELPVLLEAAQAQEVTLLSVLLGPCAFARTSLYQYPVVNSISQPLMEMIPYEQDIVWAKIADFVNGN